MGIRIGGPEAAQVSAKPPSCFEMVL
jgi:hypothetical protein